MYKKMVKVKLYFEINYEPAVKKQKRRWFVMCAR